MYVCARLDSSIISRTFLYTEEDVVSGFMTLLLHMIVCVCCVVVGVKCLRMSFMYFLMKGIKLVKIFLALVLVLFSILVAVLNY